MNELYECAEFPDKVSLLMRKDWDILKQDEFKVIVDKFEQLTSCSLACLERAFNSERHNSFDS